MYKLTCGLLIAVLMLAGCGSDTTEPPRCSPAAQAAPALRISAPSTSTSTTVATPAALNRRPMVYGASMPFAIPDGPAPAMDPSAGIFLPSTLYLVAGQTYRLEFAKNQRVRQ